MRVMIKGGVWKNTEDEILKAAVMKYGKTQWSRVASLLPRKSAKQCKARWLEWLDPSVKKTEWSREEDEKLLHLAKLMPTQWRSIAPIVGRTAAQCLERYDKLLDLAQAKDGEPVEDVRRLRPGEIDPFPETRRARPDPVDMDEDEKEMLNEARARLANTKGKKAKRKAREKQLEEARRLAAMQKRRELRAAGIDTSRIRRRLKKGEMDYVREIPFAKPAPIGFFDTSEERARPDGEDASRVTGRAALQEEKRRDVEEERLRKQDRKRQRRIEEENLPGAVMQVSAVNDPLAVRKRSRLMLPPPSVTDRELEDVVKAGSALLGATPLGGPGATPALRALMGPPGSTPAPTPLRGSSSSAHDVVMEEARNIIALSTAPTPLQGGDNPELSGGTGFEGATPANHLARGRTPRGGPGAAVTGATPLRTPGATPARGGGGVPGATPLVHTGATPLRGDGDSMALVSADAARQQRLLEKAQREQLRSALAALPEPQYQYEVVVPEGPGAGTAELSEQEQLEEDAADADARAAARVAARKEAELSRRSAVLKQGLPRPLGVSAELSSSLLDAEEDERGGAHAPVDPEVLVRAEVARLLRYEEAKYPLPSRKDKKRESRRDHAVPELLPLPDELVQEARQLVRAEAEVVRREYEERWGTAQAEEQEKEERWASVWAEEALEVVEVPSTKTFSLFGELAADQQVESLSHRLSQLRDVMAQQAERAQKLENKLRVVTKGYVRRGAQLAESLQTTVAQLDAAATEAACFSRLAVQETAALPRRVQELEEQLRAQRDAEAALQERFAQLSEERDALHRALFTIAAAPTAHAPAAAGAVAGAGTVAQAAQ